MITIKQIFDCLNEVAPVDTAESWDNVGILVGAKKNKSVDKVMVTLDVTSSVVDEAIKKDVHLIISHHPFIFDPIKTITDDSWQGRALIKLLKNDITVISMHTNMDKAENGLNYYLAKTIGLTAIHKIEECEYIRVGQLQSPILIDDLAVQVKNALNIPSVRVVMPKNKIDKVQRVAVFSGKSDIQSVLDNSKYYDVAVCGDIGYHVACDISYGSIPVIDAGHYGTEWIFVDLIRELLNEKLPKIEVLTATTHINPFVML